MTLISIIREYIRNLDKGFTHNDIAEATGIELGVVASTLNRLRAAEEIHIVSRIPNKKTRPTSVYAAFNLAPFNNPIIKKRKESPWEAVYPDLIVHQGVPERYIYRHLMSEDD